MNFFIPYLTQADYYLLHAMMDGIITVLSGMSDTAQMEDNLSYYEEIPAFEGGRAEAHPAGGRFSDRGLESAA